MGTAWLHVLGPAGGGRGPGRAERRGQDHAAFADRGAAGADRRRDRGLRRDLTGAHRGHAGPGQLPRPGPSAVRRLHRRGHVPLRPFDEPAVGPDAGPGAGGRARHPAAAEGQGPVRRPAGAGSADYGAGQARSAARPGRAGREPGSGRPAGVHAGRDGHGRRHRPHRDHRFARDLRAGTALRLAARANRRAAAAGGPGRRPTRRAPGADRAAADPGRRPARHGHQPRRQRPALDRAGGRRRGAAGAGAASWMAGGAGQLRAAAAGLPAALARGGGRWRARPPRRAVRTAVTS